MSSVNREDEPDPADGTDERLIVLLAEGESYEGIARVLNRSVRTVRRRASDPEVRRGVLRRRHDMASAAAGRFAGLLDDAIGVVQRALGDEDAPVRLRAANAVFDRYLAFRREADAADAVAEIRRELSELRAEVVGEEEE